MSKCTVFFAEGVIQQCTSEQFEAIKHMAQSDMRKEITVWPRAFDLPEGYLAFNYSYHDGGRIYGGIAANGDVST